MQYKNFITIALFVFLNSCIKHYTLPVDDPVARVNNKYLYKKDLKDLFTQKLSAMDSVVVAQTYIDNWIKEQLVLSMAETNLTEEEKDVSKKLESYRNSLLIYKYQENYIKQNLDTVIKDAEIQSYYNNNTQNFIMDNNLVKGHYIKISDKLPLQDISKVRQWIQSSKEEDYQSLYDYCMQYAEKFDDFDKTWVIFEMIQLQFPMKIYRPEVTLKFNKYFEIKDSAYYYFMKINDVVSKSEVAPLDYIEEKIKSIIINKRKITLIKRLESEVYNDALNRDLVQKF